MTDEIMGKRANGAGGGGSGDGGSGSGGPPARGPRSRSAATTTINIAARFRDDFDTFVQAGYRIAALEGVRGIAARRQLIERIKAHRPLMDEWLDVLQAEIIDMTRASALNGGRDEDT